jgi:hypothetical protein
VLDLRLNPIKGYLGATTLAATLLTGCNGLWLDTYWRSERYILTAVDALGQMSLDFDIGDGTAIGLVEPNVFSVGADDRYIVVKRHPGNAFGEFDRTITEYFIVKRVDGNFEARKSAVQGPITSAAFNQLASELHLPPFSKTIKELE